MRALARDGWRSLTLAQYAASPRPAPRTVLISFDDGYASLAEFAYPVLADLGLTATTFLVTDFVGRTNTWDVRYTWHRPPHLDSAVSEHFHPPPSSLASLPSIHPP